MQLSDLSKLPRKLHAFGCVVMLTLISWALLSSDPFAAVRHTPLTYLKTVSDILLHCGAYTAFSVACCSMISRTAEARVHGIVIGLLIVHGIGTELLQGMLPNRNSDPLDAVANLSGIAAGALLAAWAVRPALNKSANQRTFG